jgi:hypothetical protein
MAGLNKFSRYLGARATCCPEYVHPFITEKANTGDRRWQRLVSRTIRENQREDGKGVLMSVQASCSSLIQTGRTAVFIHSATNKHTGYQFRPLPHRSSSASRTICVHAHSYEHTAATQSVTSLADLRSDGD